MRKPTKQAIFFLAALPVMLLTAAAPASAEASATSSAFDEILEHYEAVRQALTADAVEGVSDHGRAIHGILEGLNTEWSAARAGVQSDQAEEAQKLLPDLTAAATALAQAGGLEASRDAFYALSKPLVRWRKAAVRERPVVAYCSMAKRSWLQPEGELGNPYYGQSMPRCGELVDG